MFFLTFQKPLPWLKETGCKLNDGRWLTVMKAAME